MEKTLIWSWRIAFSLKYFTFLPKHLVHAQVPFDFRVLYKRFVLLMCVQTGYFKNTLFLQMEAVVSVPRP